MIMKRFLILFALIAFSGVSCAGPGKVGWTRPRGDFRQDEFEQDRKQCIESIGQTLEPEAFGQALEECLFWKGYKYKTPEEGKMGQWKKPDFGQDQFDKDLEECKQATFNDKDRDVDHPLTVAECLAEKGYAFEPPTANKKDPVTVLKVLEVSGLVVLGLALFALRVAAGGM
jgi:hypothetical protein